jgi:dGTP triphosphohydrolase
MKTFIKILLISSFFFSCMGKNQGESTNSADSTRAMLPPDSTQVGNGNEGSNGSETTDPAREANRQLVANLISAKKEISELKSDVRDSLSKSGLSQEQRLLFSQTIQQLDESSRLVNRQIEQILVTDLQESRGKLSEIVRKMKASEKELGGMILRLDRISNYMQVATGLLQSLVPMPAAKSHSADEK